MRIKKVLKFIGFLLAVVPFTCTACNSNNNSHETPSPKYLLDGIKTAESGNFEYYSIENDTEYAIALKESAKSSTNAIVFDSTYNGKPVTGIWRYGFANSQATSITIPSGIKVIDYEAFMNSKITNVTIPATITAIGEGAFYSCKSLSKASIQNTTTASETSSACSCSEDFNNEEEERDECELTNIPAFCFFNCNSLKELVLPESIEEIEYEAFNGCRSLYSTLAFTSIKAIRSRAFQGCASLKNIYISSSFFAKDENQVPIGVIEDKAFEDCNSSLKFWLVGSTSDVQAWLNLHLDNKWRWKNETTNPGNVANLYAYEITASGASYSSDWIYTTVNHEVEITSYIGPTEIDGTPIKFLTFPNELPSGTGNKVRKITTDALNTVKANLERIYLPKTLKRIESGMFNGDYDKLIVVDDNTKCSADEALIEAQQSLTPRIILNGLTELEVIGNSAFVDMDKLATMQKLYLPYSLKAVGKNAFGATGAGKHMKAVTDFRWDYDDDSEKCALEVIGREAFYELGRSDNNGSFTGGTIHQGHLYVQNGQEKVRYQLTTVIFPRTFKHFGITDSDNTTYALGGAETNDANFGISAFAGCPLLSEVVFRGSKESKVKAGSNSDNETCDLVIAPQTFVMNESLRTIVFEERCGKSILFHANKGNINSGTNQPAIGWSAGKAKNDFGGDPAIQTIVLPNRFTTIRMQKFAMQGNSRGAVYFSGSSTLNADNTTLKGSTTEKCADAIANITANQNNINNVGEWRLIGNENVYSNCYPGYCFTDKNKNDIQNKYGINQSMPVYGDVLYKETINKPGIDNIQVSVGLGPTDSANEFVIKDKCAFVCGASTATMTKYLYDRYDTSFTGTATVPATVTRSDETECSVTVIGASAFSAAYCDSTSYANDTLHKDLKTVLVPSTITTISEYAFMRAYGITKLTSYNASTGVANDDYVMPSALTTIGKHAFAFCNIKEFLNIPNSCRFYENTNNTTYETSVFSNNFSLRKITFGNNSTSSTYYNTTTYTHTGSSDVYTSAIYSTNSVSKNKSSLLLVLNRDSADYLVAAQDSGSVSITFSGQTNNYSEFNGRYANQYLYGAFKMCYWVDSLVVGSAIDATKNQPLISGFDDNNGHKDKIIYLNNYKDFTSNTCNLKAISFGSATTIATPPYSFEGCENLTKIKLPRVEHGHVPAGLFAFLDNEHVVFEVPSDTTGTNFTECSEGVLDLSYTGYDYIDAEAFKGTNINTLIAPKPYEVDPEDGSKLLANTFTIEQDAFANCSSLTSINFSNVTGRVVLHASFRGSSIPNDLFNFGSSALIEFGDETFKGCSFPGKTFTFPEKTAIIGNYCFENCNVSNKELVNVGASANLTYLERVAVDKAEGKNNYNYGDPGGFKQIGNYAFFGCTELKNFDLSKFTELERIGHYAFGMAKFTDNTNKTIKPDTSAVTNNASICTNGIINLPTSLTNLGVGAFFGTKITSVTINSTDMKFERGKDYTSDTRAQYNKGGHTFRRCASLTKIFFSEPNCTWNTPFLLKSENDQSCYFTECTSLTEVYLPTGFNLQYERYTGTGSNPPNDKRPDSMVWDSNSSLKFYVYHTVYDLVPTPPISDFWHRMGSGSTAPIVFYVGTNADVVANNSGTYSEYRSGTVYWTIYNGTPVYLGTATVNSTTGVVTFQTAGYTADSSGVQHP